MSAPTRHCVGERLLAFAALNGHNRDQALRVVWAALSIDAGAESRDVPPAWLQGRMPKIPPLWPSSHALKRAQADWDAADQDARELRMALIKKYHATDGETHYDSEAFFAKEAWDINELMRGPNWKWRPPGWDDGKSPVGIPVKSPESAEASETGAETRVS